MLHIFKKKVGRTVNSQCCTEELYLKATYKTELLAEQQRRTIKINQEKCQCKKRLCYRELYLRLNG